MSTISLFTCCMPCSPHFFFFFKMTRPPRNSPLSPHPPLSRLKDPAGAAKGGTVFGQRVPVGVGADILQAIPKMALEFGRQPVVVAVTEGGCAGNAANIRNG